MRLISATLGPSSDHREQKRQCAVGSRLANLVASTEVPYRRESIGLSNGQRSCGGLAFTNAWQAAGVMPFSVPPNRLLSRQMGQGSQSDSMMQPINLNPGEKLAGRVEEAYTVRRVFRWGFPGCA